MMAFNQGRDNEKDNKASDQICCLQEGGSRCKRPAGNASFNYRVQKLVRQKKLGFCLDSHVRHLYICDHHKNVIQKARNKPKGKVKEDDEGDNPEIDISQLQVSTLRRYKRFYKIPTRPGMNKSQLVEAISKHFRTIPVQEKETITYFIYMVKTHKSKLDQRPPDGVTS